jgi:hypothetical protein
MLLGSLPTVFSEGGKNIIPEEKGNLEIKKPCEPPAVGAV